MKASKKTEVAKLGEEINLSGINRVLEYKADECRKHVKAGGELNMQWAKEYLEFYDGMVFFAESMGYNVEFEKKVSAELFTLWNRASG